MKKAITNLLAVSFTLLAFSTHAQLYWDSNGSAAGAGGATPTGTWGADDYWNPSADGDAATGPWSDGNTAVFAAGTDATGTYTVTVNGAPAVVGLTFEEGNVTLSGGTIDFPNGGSIEVSATQATINSVISGGAGQITQGAVGAGTLVLGGNNTFNNTYGITQGTLRMGAAGDILPSATVALSFGTTLDLNNYSVGIGGLGVATFSAGSSVNLGSGTLTNLGTVPNSRYDGVISGSGNLVKAGTNTLTLSAQNTFTGRTIILGGVLSLAATPPNDPLGTPPGAYVADQLILDGGTLNFPSTSPTNIVATRGVFLGPAGGTITMGSSKSPSIESSITGPGGLTKPSTGNLTLPGINTFAGDFTIRAGGVRFNSDAAAGTGKVIISPDANVFLRNLAPPGNVSTLTNAITVNAGVGIVEFVTGSGDTFIVSGPISGAGPMVRGQTQAGNAGLLVLSGDNSGWSGGFWLLRGRTALGHRNALGTGALVLQPASAGVNTVVLLATTPLTGANAVANPVTINITNAFTNALLNLAIGGSNPLELSGPIELSSTNSPLITPILNVTNTGGTILSGAIGGGAGVGLTKEGVETLTLSGANTYSGVTTVNAGTLLVNAPGSLAGGGVVVNAGATLGGSGTINGAVTVNAGGSVGAGASAGTLTLAGGLNLSAGGTNVWELAANSASNPGTDFDQIVVTGGNLVLGGSSVLQVRLTGSANLADPFWQANHTWKVIALNGGANPGNTVFAALDGTNGITVGTFATAVDANGVYLNYTASVVAQPSFSSVSLAAGNVILQGANGSAGGSYSVLTSTNVALPLSNWTTNATGNFDGSGGFSNGIPFDAGDRQRFFRIKTP